MGSDNKRKGTRNLSYQEFLKQQEEGRCFRCKGSFSPDHHCPEQSLWVVILGKDEEGEPKEAKAEMDQKQKELSSILTGGLTQPKTMKLQGKIRKRTVLILIDSGVCHNFISKELVKELGLEVKDTRPYHVSLWDGQKKKTQGCCKVVVLQLGKAEIVKLYYLFELGGIDLTLGVDWLAKLGEVTTDWGKLIMVFRQGGKEVII